MGDTKKETQSQSTQTSAQWIARAGVLILGIVLLRMGFEIWWVGRIHEHIVVQLSLSLLYFFGIMFLLLGSLDIDHAKLDKLGFIAITFALLFYSLVNVQIVANTYNSDALLFVHEASRYLLIGLNPYEQDLIGGYEGFAVPYYVQTPTTSGGIVTNLNYPALSFLIYMPFVALGVPDVRLVSMGFLLAIIGLLYLWAPRHVRLLALSLVLMSSFFLAFTLSGFDIIYVFFLIVTIIFWKRRNSLALIAYGLSCAIKQQVWFIAPFILIRIIKETDPELQGLERWKQIGAKLLLPTIAFIIPNAIFIAWHPEAWFRGVLTPLGASGDSLVPLVQGIFISFYTGDLYPDPRLITLMMLSAWLGLIMLYWTYFPKMRDFLWISPAIVLVFNARALQNYYEMFYPVAIVILLMRMPREWIEQGKKMHPDQAVLPEEEDA